MEHITFAGLAWPRTPVSTSTVHDRDKVPPQHGTMYLKPLIPGPHPGPHLVSELLPVLFLVPVYADLNHHRLFTVLGPYFFLNKLLKPNHYSLVIEQLNIELL